MDYTKVPYTTYLKQTLSRLTDPGLLLVSAAGDGKPNAMTIGWGTVGVIWGKPIFVVLVRPSRYTYSLLEASDSFTVCVPSVRASFTPVRVIVWGMFQSPLVKVSVPEDTVTSVVSMLLTSSTT